MSIIHGFYRQRPDIIEAFYFDGREVTADVIIKWASSARTKKFYNFLTDSYQLDLYTSKGTLHAGRGDWIVKSASNEIYPIAGDEFETTYELAEPVLKDEGSTNAD